MFVFTADANTPAYIKIKFLIRTLDRLRSLEKQIEALECQKFSLQLAIEHVAVQENEQTFDLVSLYSELSRVLAEFKKCSSALEQLANHDDELLMLAATEFCKNRQASHGAVSIAALQRALGLGYNRAHSIIETLKERQEI
ncbi:hypothetical protein B0181_04435 [Moraxella caviae]|uniref:Ftsk gamma domain n=1 Tax=Moraxella caviae TaxID=34060 RepID=A0A1T0A4Z6_9GAMM|nr:DNA translocase FtsK [Moraxella caviae]OOR90843.1 hypothetical protein B0181_04435 [Moraxella caviae]STZ10678.1 Ftsk gamma domain [Moraxella caviae]